MINYWQHLRQHWLWLFICLSMSCGVWGLNFAFGSPKALQDINWFDVVGEGSTAIFLFFWLLIVLIFRDKSPISSLFAIGFIGLHLSSLQDVIDEFIKLPDSVWFDAVIESQPIGVIALSAALLAWSKEHTMFLHMFRYRKGNFRPTQGLDLVSHLPQYNHKVINEHPDRNYYHLQVSLNNYSRLSNSCSNKSLKKLMIKCADLLLLNRLESEKVYSLGSEYFVVVGAKDEAKSGQRCESLAACLNQAPWYIEQQQSTLNFSVNSLALSDPSFAHVRRT